MPDRTDLGLPTVEAVDALPPDALLPFALQLTALLSRASVRMVAVAPAPQNGSAAGPPYTLAEAAALLGKTTVWLRRKAASGAIPCARKMGRSWIFPCAAFDRLRERGVGA